MRLQCANALWTTALTRANQSHAQHGVQMSSAGCEGLTSSASTSPSTEDVIGGHRCPSFLQGLPHVLQDSTAKLSEQALDDNAGFLRGGLYGNHMSSCHEDGHRTQVKHQ